MSMLSRMKRYRLFVWTVGIGLFAGSCNTGLSLTCGACEGCCLADGTCAPGDHDDSCGQNGEQCSNCNSSGQVCTTGSCAACVGESDIAFCAALGKNCGSVTGYDNCGHSRSANCGTCTAPQFCGGGGPNVCDNGSDAGLVPPDGSVIPSDGGVNLADGGGIDSDGSVIPPDAGTIVDAGSCPDACSGCCVLGLCLPYSLQSIQLCGASSATCAMCGTGQTCVSGVCTTCSGCITSNGVCEPGDSPTSGCGLGGVSCVTCGPEQCVNGTCGVSTFGGAGPPCGGNYSVTANPSTGTCFQTGDSMWNPSTWGMTQVNGMVSAVDLNGPSGVVTYSGTWSGSAFQMTGTYSYPDNQGGTVTTDASMSGTFNTCSSWTATDTEQTTDTFFGSCSITWNLTGVRK
jgi:hypothetical protein